MQLFKLSVSGTFSLAPVTLQAQGALQKQPRYIKSSCSPCPWQCCQTEASMCLVLLKQCWEHLCTLISCGASCKNSSVHKPPLSLSRRNPMELRVTSLLP